VSTTPPPPPQSPYTPPSAIGPPVPPQGESRLPWEERNRLGVLEALIQTLRLLVTDPSNAFSRLRRDGDITSPILFGIIFGWLSVFFAQIWQLMLGSAFSSVSGRLEGFEYLGQQPGGVAAVLVTLVITPIFVVIAMFLGAGLYHLCLMVVGATESSPTGFEGTLKVYAYSQIAGLATVLPLLGSFVYVIWAIVLAVIGYSTVHRTTTGKALIAVLIPLLLCCACVIVVAIFFGAILSTIIAGMAESGI
jgi:hypothetical protein